jgi:hypothetical protein
MRRHGVTYIPHGNGFVRLRGQAPGLPALKPLIVETSIAGGVVDRREIAPGRWVVYDVPARRSAAAPFPTPPPSLNSPVSVLTLGIETSCDDTSIALLEDDSALLANVVSSQVEHAAYGGVVPEIASRFTQAFGRASGGLLHRYRTEGAETIVVALGSVLGTVEDVVDGLRESGERIGALGITCFRPFPLEEVRAALAEARRVVVVERAFAVGIGGIVGQNVRLALDGLPPLVHDVVAGLGGRAVTRRSLESLLADLRAGRLEPGRLHFLDLDTHLVERELQRLQERRRSGAHAENILRDLGAVAARPY